MADTTTTGTTTTSKVADYSGEDAESILTVMPSALDYTAAKYGGDAKAAKKAYNRDFKSWQNTAYELANPTEAVAKKVKGRMTPEQARDAVKDASWGDVTDSQMAQMTKMVADGDGKVTFKQASIAVLTYHYNYCLKGVAKMDILLTIAENMPA